MRARKIMSIRLTLIDSVNRRFDADFPKPKKIAANYSPGLPCHYLRFRNQLLHE
jgi:hypothetical protein